MIESEVGDSIAIRSMVYISMSYDHRVVDGALGAQLLAVFKAFVEKPVTFLV